MEQSPLPGYADGQSVTDGAANQSVFQERLRLALEAGEMGAWEFRVPEGRVLWSETLERIHGLEPGTFGGTFEDYKRDIHPDDRSLVFETVSHTLAGAPHRLRYRIIRPDGAMRWVEARGTLLEDGEGERRIASSASAWMSPSASSPSRISSASARSSGARPRHSRAQRSAPAHERGAAQGARGRGGGGALGDAVF